MGTFSLHMYIPPPIHSQSFPENGSSVWIKWEAWELDKEYTCAYCTQIFCVVLRRVTDVYLPGWESGMLLTATTGTYLQPLWSYMYVLRYVYTVSASCYVNVYVYVYIMYMYIYLLM